MRLVNVLISGLLLTTATVNASAATPTQTSFDALYQEAKEAREQAAQVGGEWRDVGKMFADTKQAADAGDMSKAQQLVGLTKTHNKLGNQSAAHLTQETT